MKNTVKVYLQNARSLLTACGYGVGDTFESAKADALKLALQRDPNAYFDAGSNTVVFSEQCYIG